MKNTLFLAFTLFVTGCGASLSTLPIQQDLYNLKGLKAKAATGTAEDQYRYGLSLFAAGFDSRAIVFHPVEQKEMLQEVIIWYRKSASKGYVKAKTNLGNLLRTQLRNYKEAIPLLTDAAKHGDAQAAYNLGEYYDLYYGWSGEPSNVDEAIKWYIKAAIKGSLDAQNRLGEIYYNSRKDYVSAYAWLLIAKTAKLNPSGHYVYNELNEKILSIQKAEAEKLAMTLMKEFPAFSNTISISDRHLYEDDFGHLPQ